MSSFKEDPLYVHDCDKCEFLGRWRGYFNKSEKGPMQNYDLYVCGDNVVARYGNDGPEYTSGTVFVGTINPLTEAARRCKDRNIDLKERAESKRNKFLLDSYKQYKTHSDLFTVLQLLEAIRVKSYFIDDDYLKSMEFVLRQSEDWTEPEITTAIHFLNACNLSEEI